jgi:thiamine-monophosphate kinase
MPVGGRKIALKVDMLVQGTDVPEGMTFRQAARKAVAMCVSDFAAKGVKPDSFMVSLGVSRAVTAAQARELSLGLRDAAREWSLRLVGGDTGEARELIVNCAMVGFAGRFVTRDGAKPGDAVVVTGRFGYQAAGLRILQRGASCSSSFRRIATRSILLPTPNLKLGLALAGYWTSALDSSDGLARSLHILSEASGMGIEVLELPMAEGVAEFARRNGVSARGLVLGGGEEYLIVGTMRPAKVADAARVARRHGGELVEIGRVTLSPRRVLLRVGRRALPIADVGWVHLR